MKILVIEDEASLRLGIARTLQRAGHGVDIADCGTKGLELFRNAGYDLVITDLMLPDIGGMDVLKAVKDISSETGIVIITAYANVKTAVEAMRAGAYDYLSKPFDPEELLIMIERWTRQRRLELDNDLLREELRVTRFADMIGSSGAMREVFTAIRQVAPTDSSVIIYGETGTGKELAANAIHELSSRKARPFIKINCAAIPEALLESELFGHEKGAFTGALQRKKGKFEVAHGGTILFDEIGDMPMALQAKLLRVLENLTFERVGGNEQLTVNVRTIYATRRDLKEEIQARRFREDLFYRINVVPLMLPPLRERKADIPELALEFLNAFCARNGKPGVRFDEDAMRLLMRYDYPGNVRELKHAVEMAATLCGGMIRAANLPVAMRDRADTPALEASFSTATLEEQTKAAERAIISRAIEEAGGRKSLAAANLGISRKTLWRKLREHNFPESEFEQD